MKHRSYRCSCGEIVAKGKCLECAKHWITIVNGCHKCKLNIKNQK